MAIFQQSVTSVERTSNHSFLFQLMSFIYYYSPMSVVVMPTL